LKHPQHIVAFERSYFGPLNEGLNLMDFSELLERAEPSLIIGRRNELEDSPAFGQMLPYILFHRTDKDGKVSLFTYRRGKGIGENRLLGKYSVGIGGHVDLADVVFSSNSVFGFFATLDNAMRRELAEEISFSGKYSNSNITFIGAINDNSDPVGRVHTGLLLAVSLPEGSEIATTEPELQTIGMIDEDGFSGLDLENWSKIVIDNLDRIKQVIKGK
jgi:predicted NUDIX family phosphoesterase